MSEIEIVVEMLKAAGLPAYADGVKIYIPSIKDKERVWYSTPLIGSKLRFCGLIVDLADPQWDRSIQAVIRGREYCHNISCGACPARGDGLWYE